MDWPFSHELLYWEKTMDDPDYVSQPESDNSQDAESDNSSTLSNPPAIIFHSPDCIESLLNGHSQFSFNDVPQLGFKSPVAQPVKDRRLNCTTTF